MKKQLLKEKINFCGMKRMKQWMILAIGCIAAHANAQMVVNGANAKIVCVGSSHIVLNDMSYANEASSTHISGTDLTLKFVGVGSTSTSITSSSSFTTNASNVVIDRTNGVQLGAPLAIANTLTLTNGKLDLMAFNLDASNALINGGSSLSYVKTSGIGNLKRNVLSTGTTFYPIGNNAYNPAELINTIGSDNFSVRVIDAVYVNGSSGTQQLSSVVGRTWLIDEAVVGGNSVKLRLYWNGPGEELSGFLSTDAFVAHYVSSASIWDNIGGTVQAGYIESSQPMNSFSPFTISSSPTFAPLPVELLSLDAQCAHEEVIVSWKTATEHNTLNFAVERSEDGITWNEMQTVSAAVNSNTIREYAVQDAGAARGVHYYRLIQTDQDGMQKIYGPIMSNCGSDKISFLTFPNPSDNEFTLVINGLEIVGETTLNVRDANGKLVRSLALEIQPGVNSFLVPDLQIAPGMYYLQLENDNYRSPSLKQSIR